MTILKDGEKNLYLNSGIGLTNSLIICSEAPKSAITPSLRGLMVLMPS